MSQEAKELPMRNIAIMRICWHILNMKFLNRKQTKPINDCAEAIMKSLEEEFGYRKQPEVSQDKELSSNWQKIDQLCLEAGTPIRGSLIGEICQLFKQPELLTDEELKQLEEPCALDNPCPFNISKIPYFANQHELDMMCDLCLRQVVAKAQLDKK